ncbi:hypothetical protein HNR56_004016 [Roseospira marina]|nr:hypothetical protein [Roseospira marina]
MAVRPLPVVPPMPAPLAAQLAAQPPAGIQTGDPATDAALARRRADLEGALAVTITRPRWHRARRPRGAADR